MFTCTGRIIEIFKRSNAKYIYKTLMVEIPSNKYILHSLHNFCTLFMGHPAYNKIDNKL